jgi:3',5'-cyclic-AMP phosphodiesterase
MAREAIRFAHLSDMHVEPPPKADAPSRHSREGTIAAFKSLRQLVPQADFLITGGDHIMDALERTRDDVLRQWAMYKEIVRDHCPYKVYPVIGNHDVFGWMTDAVPPETEGYGKVLACEQLGLAEPYYSFDHGAWHFVVLDNTQPCPRGYLGGLDTRQMQWLVADLAAVPKGRHTCIVSHIPIVSICAQHFFSPDQRVDFWKIYDVFVHHDARDLVELLARHEVKLCVSSHIHMLDKVEFRGVNFICDGSISGDWWKGPFRGFPEGYGIFDLNPDGTFAYEYKAFGWKAPKD